MTKLFIDTSGWANIIDISQPYHHQAAKIYQDYRSQKYKIITTNYIICELVALLSSPLRIPRNGCDLHMIPSRLWKILA
jgi:predicted nucleic acid-binding protein